MSDDDGTHYLVTDLTDPQFAGLVTPDDFADLIAARNADVIAQETARDNGDIIGGITAIAIPFLLIFCPETFGTSCAAAGFTMFLTGAIGSGTNYNSAENAAERIAQTEESLRGRFEQMLVAAQAP